MQITKRFKTAQITTVPDYEPQNKQMQEKKHKVLNETNKENIIQSHASKLALKNLHLLWLQHTIGHK